MKTLFVTLLKIAVVAVLFWLILNHAPMIAVPLMGALGAALLVLLGLLITATLGLGLGLAVVAVLLTLACSVAVALAPVWLPLLAIVGLVALCRPKRAVA